MYLKALKWVGIVAICLGIVCTIYITGYNSGVDSEASDCKAETIQIMKNQLERNRKLIVELERRDEEITKLTTQYHKNIDKIQRDADTTINTLRLRDDLTRRDCLPRAGDTERDIGTNQCGLRERDVEDLIGLAARADETAEKLKACQGILWTLKKDSTRLRKE